MSSYAFHLGQIISTVLGQVDHDGKHGNAARTPIRDEMSETDHTQKRRFRHSAIYQTIKALAILRCLFGSEMVVLEVVLGKCKMPSTDISQENDHGDFLNLFDRNIIGTYLIILSLFWCKIVIFSARNNNLKCTYLLQMDVFGQILHSTPLFMADLVEILPNMQFSSNIMVSSTF
jgi:hypothetical protein